MSIVQVARRAVPSTEACALVYRHGQRVVCVAGWHDKSTVARLAAELAEVMSWDKRDVVVDLHAVRFMDSSTVRVFLRAEAFLAARGRALLLQFPSPHARRALDLCHVEYDLAPARPTGADLHLVPDECD